jgi:hypothetical protein
MHATRRGGSRSGAELLLFSGRLANVTVEVKRRAPIRSHGTSPQGVDQKVRTWNPQGWRST